MSKKGEVLDFTRKEPSKDDTVDKYFQEREVKDPLPIPVGAAFIVKNPIMEQRRDSKIHIPDTVLEKYNEEAFHKMNKLEVLAVGDECRFLKAGMTVKVGKSYVQSGDTVGSNLEYIIFKEAWVVCIYPDGEKTKGTSK